MGLARQSPAPMPPRVPISPSFMSASPGGDQRPSEKAVCNGLRSGGLLGIPQRLWPRQSRQLPGRGAEGQLPSVGAYIQILMVGRKPGRGPEASSRRKGKGALGVAPEAPSACPERTHSQWHWLTSICAWEFPAQSWSRTQTLQLDQGHSGKCSPLGVRRAPGQDFPGCFVKEQPMELS